MINHAKSRKRDLSRFPPPSRPSRPPSLLKIFRAPDEVRGAKRRNLLKSPASPHEPDLLFSIAQPPSLSGLSSPSLLSTSRFGSLAGSQSLKKFFFGARPPESNINQITPSSRTPTFFGFPVVVTPPPLLL